MPPKPAPTPVPSTLLSTESLAGDLMSLTGLSNLRHARLIGLLLELVLLIAFYLALRIATGRLLRQLSDRLAARAQDPAHPRQTSRSRTLIGLTRNLITFLLSFAFLVSLLGLLGVNVAGIVGTASVAGLAFGFGAQKLVKDVITGFFLLLEDQYAVGDYVTIGTVSGVVEELGMRITRIRDDEGKLHTLSNGDIAQVCNQSRGPISGSFEIGIGAMADRSAAVAALTPALASVSESLGLAEPARIEGVGATDAARTTLRIVFRTQPGQRPSAVLPTLRQAARDALVSAGIPLG